MKKPNKADLEAITAYEEGCNKLMERCANKLGVDMSDCFWVADNIGDICAIGDFYFSTDSMKIFLEANLTIDEMLEWYDYTIESEELHLNTPNLRSWVKGCPRASKEQLELLRELKNDKLLKPTD